MDAQIVLLINPGSSTTKLALYEKGALKTSSYNEHDPHLLATYATVIDQLPFRLEIVLSFLRQAKIQGGELALIMCRGGLLHPLRGGVYRVTSAMLDDLKSARWGEHACNLGALLGSEIAKRYGCEAYVADPVVVDELSDTARVSGMPEIQRRSIFHALNHKYVGCLAAKQLNLKYEQARLIIAHMGGGVSVGSHLYGNVVDVNNALDGDGPLSVERSGGVPIGSLLDLAYSGTYLEAELRKKIVPEGGLKAYCGTRDLRVLEARMLEGDKQAEFFLEVFAYQVSKEIGSHLAVLHGSVDALVLTGGVANSTLIVDKIRSRVGFFAPVLVFPGELEMASLAENAYAVLQKSREVFEYE